MCNLFYRLQPSKAFKLICCAQGIDINLPLQLSAVIKDLMTQDGTSVLPNWVFVQQVQLCSFVVFVVGRIVDSDAVALPERSAAVQQPQASAACAVRSCCSTC